MSIDVGGAAKKHLSSTFIEECREIKEDEVGSLIVQATREISSLKSEMKGDERLEAAKQIVKDLRGAYTSSIKYSQDKIKFLVNKLDELEDAGEDANPHSSLKEPTI